MKEISYESLTENIITYCDGDFIKEYSRLTKPQNNIHIYRGKIITMLEQMQNDDEMYELITIGCVNEEDIEATGNQRYKDSAFSCYNQVNERIFMEYLEFERILSAKQTIAINHTPCWAM